jgi:hypothetical protein
MSQPRNTVSIDPALLAMLKDNAVAYDLVSGKRHIHLRIGGRLALVLPRGTSHSYYGRRNARAQLRRFLREQEAGLRPESEA